MSAYDIMIVMAPMAALWLFMMIAFLLMEINTFRDT
jgi:hypothetical protein